MPNSTPNRLNAGGGLQRVEVMRFWLLLIFLVCIAGFALTSGTVTLRNGGVVMNMDAVAHFLPVLLALAAPMVTMAVVLMVTMLLGRDNRHRSNRFR